MTLFFLNAGQAKLQTEGKQGVGLYKLGFVVVISMAVRAFACLFFSP